MRSSGPNATRGYEFLISLNCCKMRLDFGNQQRLVAQGIRHSDWAAGNPITLGAFGKARMTELLAAVGLIAGVVAAEGTRRRN
jgi:hypothetical protein